MHQNRASKERYTCNSNKNTLNCNTISSFGTFIDSIPQDTTNISDESSDTESMEYRHSIVSDSDDTGVGLSDYITNDIDDYPDSNSEPPELYTDSESEFDGDDETIELKSDTNNNNSDIDSNIDVDELSNEILLSYSDVHSSNDNNSVNSDVESEQHSTDSNSEPSELVSDESSAYDSEKDSNDRDSFNS